MHACVIYECVPYYKALNVMGISLQVIMIVLDKVQSLNFVL